MAIFYGTAIGANTSAAPLNGVGNCARVGTYAGISTPKCVGTFADIGTSVGVGISAGVGTSLRSGTPAGIHNPAGICTSAGVSTHADVITPTSSGNFAGDSTHNVTGILDIPEMFPGVALPTCHGCSDAVKILCDTEIATNVGDVAYGICC